MTEKEFKFCKLCENTFPWTSEYFHYWNKEIGKLHPYCKSCKIEYVMAWKRGESFQKIPRAMGILRKKKLEEARKAEASFFKDEISTEDLRSKLLPFYKDKTEAVVKKLRKRMGLSGGLK